MTEAHLRNVVLVTFLINISPILPVLFLLGAIRILSGKWDDCI